MLDEILVSILFRETQWPLMLRKVAPLWAFAYDEHAPRRIKQFRCMINCTSKRQYAYIGIGPKYSLPRVRRFLKGLPRWAGTELVYYVDEDSTPNYCYTSFYYNVLDEFTRTGRFVTFHDHVVPLPNDDETQKRIRQLRNIRIMCAKTLWAVPNNWIQLMTHAHTVDLSYNEGIIDVSPLKHVCVLLLRHCESVSDVSMLGALKHLDISYTSVSDVSSLHSVHYLDVSGCVGIRDLICLARGTLVNLAVSRSQLNTIVLSADIRALEFAGKKIYRG